MLAAVSAEWYIVAVSGGDGPLWWWSGPDKICGVYDRRCMGMSKVLVMVGLVAALMAATVGVASAQEVPDLCVSVNGVERVDLGTATCSSTVSDGAANVARANGDGAFAEAGFVAGDSGNRATATGDGANAFAEDGDNNTATATGDATAFAGDGDNNIATATGDDALALAGDGDNNTATATGNCLALALGDDQTDSCTGP